MPSNYEVLLFICPVIIPFNFSSHAWFLCIVDGKISRWEVRIERDRKREQGKHLFLNAYTPFSGIGRWPFFPKKYPWKSKLIYRVNGPLAQRMTEFISMSKYNYPYKDKYFVLGPNSNTYIQWVLNNFPEFKVKLPWTCIGKDYKIKL